MTRIPPPDSAQAQNTPQGRATDNVHDEHAEAIRQIGGVTRDESDTRRRTTIRNAQWNCSQCAKCGDALAPDAPVWRQRVRLGPGFFGGHSDTVAPLCERCRADWKEFRGAEPCENCGRPVHQEYNRRIYLYTFCCSTCERAVRVAEARERRTDARDTRQCRTCGETFEPTRTDARFCSSACRQRAYRRRKAVTADECVPRDVFDSRNALAESPLLNGRRGSSHDRPPAHRFQSRRSQLRKGGGKH